MSGGELPWLSECCCISNALTLLSLLNIYSLIALSRCTLTCLNEPVYQTAPSLFHKDVVRPSAVCPSARPVPANERTAEARRNFKYDAISCNREVSSCVIRVSKCQLRRKSYQWCGLRQSVLGQDWSETNKSVLVLVLQVWCCIVKHGLVTLFVVMILKDTATFEVLFIVFLFCAWHITTVEINMAFTYLKVISAKTCLSLLPVVLVLRIWSCLHHWIILFPHWMFLGWNVRAEQTNNISAVCPVYAVL